MPDPFAPHFPTLESPAGHAAAVTPNNDTDLPTTARALYVGTMGNVKVTTTGGSVVTFVGIEGILPVRTKRVHLTGTTASNIVALW